MRAYDVAAPFPTVEMDTPALAAARQLAGQNLLGLIVVDGARRPKTILPRTPMLPMAIPSYCQDDPRTVDVPGLPAARRTGRPVPDRRSPRLQRRRNLNIGR
jgi:hypothetical protein